MSKTRIIKVTYDLDSQARITPASQERAFDFRIHTEREEFIKFTSWAMRENQTFIVTPVQL